MSINWYLAKSLETYRAEVNARWPKRRKDGDGTIGDAAHASRSSDHNPWVVDAKGRHVVTAIDITHDPAGGCDSYALAEFLRKSRDPRIKYIISNRKIASAQDDWAWRKYTGKNPHDHHMHMSVHETEALCNSTKEWGIADAHVIPATAEEHPPEMPPTLRKGAEGKYVILLQQRLGFTGKSVDGKFGEQTWSKVKSFQAAKGLKADGVVGPQTWKALEV